MADDVDVDIDSNENFRQRVHPMVVIANGPATIKVGLDVLTGPNFYPADGVHITPKNPNEQIYIHSFDSFTLEQNLAIKPGAQIINATTVVLVFEDDT